jgi:hypothetical protein
MPSLLVRVLLFLSSYFPLTLIFAVQLLLRNRPEWAAAALTLGTIGLLGISIYLRVARTLNPITIKVEIVRRRDGEAMSYIVSYLLPFLTMSSGSIGDAIGLVIFLIVLGILYINSDMIHINPMLNVAGWHVYEVEMAGGEIGTLISKRRVRRGKDASVVQMGQDIYLEPER